jgi:preprotein translocase subunit SecE
VGAEAKSMEVKKPHHSTKSAHTLATKRVKEFVEEIKSEIQKITWTSREELLAYTKIVIGATFIFGMAIYFLDLIIQGVLNGLNLLLNFIGG